MIERTCLKMHGTWNPTGAVDVGIDGFIEMFDGNNADALGKHLAVRSMAVSSLANDTGETFDFSWDAGTSRTGGRATCRSCKSWVSRGRTTMQDPIVAHSKRRGIHDGPDTRSK